MFSGFSVKNWFAGSSLLFVFSGMTIAIPAYAHFQDQDGFDFTVMEEHMLYHHLERMSERLEKVLKANPFVMTLELAPVSTGESRSYKTATESSRYFSVNGAKAHVTFQPASNFMPSGVAIDTGLSTYSFGLSAADSHPAAMAQWQACWKIAQAAAASGGHMQITATVAGSSVFDSLLNIAKRVGIQRFMFEFAPRVIEILDHVEDQNDPQIFDNDHILLLAKLDRLFINWLAMSAESDPNMTCTAL